MTREQVRLFSLSWPTVCAPTFPPVLVLFGHGTPKGLARARSEHTVHTAQSRGWDTLSNGELSNSAEQAGFDVLLTTDPRIRYQQNLNARRIVAAVASATPGSYAEVETPFDAQ